MTSFLSGSPRIDLNGDWTLRHGRQQESASRMASPVVPDTWRPLPARVPGNMEIDLARAGELPENLDRGHNIYRLRELEDHQFWYARTFEAPSEFAAARSELVLEGVDTLATVWLNGSKIGSLDNMLIPHRIDVTGRLRTGRNELVIGFDSVVLEAREHPVAPGEFAMENNWESLGIRKAAHTFGWDIMPRALSAGLWRDAYLELIPDARFRVVYLATTAVDPEKRTASLMARWDLEAAEWPLDGWKVRMTVGRPGQPDPLWREEFAVLGSHGGATPEIAGVDCWWPRGWGDACLHEVTLELIDARGMLRATWRERHGFRTVRLVMSDTTDAQGSGRFGFVVNNQPIFVRGTNWVPLDALHSRDSQRLAETVAMMAELNCNMVRCWGGNVYESDEFFRQCDELGIMVWQDFALACALYPQTPEFHEKVRREAEQIIPRLRNHASLVLWAGNNEIDAFYTFAKPGSDPNIDDQISRVVLATACRRLDPCRDYLPSSPYFSPELWQLGAPHDRRPEDHLWGPRDDFKGSYYCSSNAHFASEIGYHGCPARCSLERMMSPGQVWPGLGNEEWLTHAVRPLREGTAYNHRIPQMFKQVGILFPGVPDELDDFIFASQFSQAEALKFFIERFRLTKGRRTGMLWWNVRDGWPQISDGIVDYYGARKLAFAVVKRVQQDVCVMLDEPTGGRHQVVIVNDTLAPVTAKVRVSCEGRELFGATVDVPANDRRVLGAVPASEAAAWYHIEWRANGVVGRNHYLAGPRPFDLATCRAWYAAEGIGSSP